jgi:hypothetical protein
MMNLPPVSSYQNGFADWYIARVNGMWRSHMKEKGQALYQHVENVIAQKKAAMPTPNDVIQKHLGQNIDIYA